MKNKYVKKPYEEDMETQSAIEIAGDQTKRRPHDLALRLDFRIEGGSLQQDVL